MSSIKINNISNPDSISSIGRSDIKQTGKSDSQPIENKTSVEEDKINLSSRALKTGKLVDQLKDLPDVRQDKVNELRQSISAGTFNPSSEKIADAILKDESR